MHIHMYLCIHMCTCVCVYVYIYIYIHTCIIHIHAYIAGTGKPPRRPSGAAVRLDFSMAEDDNQAYDHSIIIVAV